MQKVGAKNFIIETYWFQSAVQELLKLGRVWALAAMHKLESQYLKAGLPVS